MLMSNASSRTCITFWKMIYRGDVPLHQLVNSYNFLGTSVGGNTQKGWDVVFYLFPQNNTIVKHINRNKISVVHLNE